MNKPVIPVPDDLDLEGSGDQQSFRVSAAAGDATVIELFDDVFPWEAKRLLGEIRGAKGKSLELRINSLGGDVFGGVAIYNALARHKGTVSIEVDGVAASIASIIAMAGDRVRMGEGAWMMIHEPHAGMHGTAKDLKATAELLDKVRDSMADIYARRTGQTKEALLAMMAAETWIPASEAVELGFADATNGIAKLAARVEPGRYSNAPPELMARAEAPEETQAIGPDDIKAAIAAMDDERVLRGLASNIGNRIQQITTGGAHATPSDPVTTVTPEAQTEPPPNVPPAEAADARTDEPPPPSGADPLAVEATLERIRRIREAATTATA